VKCQASLPSFPLSVLLPLGGNLQESIKVVLLLTGRMEPGRSTGGAGATLLPYPSLPPEKELKKTLRIIKD